MKLTVLGCAGTFPRPDSPCSGYLIEHEGFRLVVDLGSGVVGSLQSHIGLLDVDAVYVSHLHADHCLDLVAYSYARRHHPDGIPPPLPVFGPAGTQERIHRAFEARPPRDLAEVYDFREVAPGSREIGPFSVTSARMNHPIECHGLRIEAGGRSLVYSGDTGESEALVTLARDCDLLLCEASWTHGPQRPPGIHLSGCEAGEHAARAGARRLLLTHLVAWTDPDTIVEEAGGTFAGPVELARCGQEHDLELGSPGDST